MLSVAKENVEVVREFAHASARFARRGEQRRRETGRAHGGDQKVNVEISKHGRDLRVGRVRTRLPADWKKVE